MQSQSEGTVGMKGSDLRMYFQSISNLSSKQTNCSLSTEEVNEKSNDLSTDRQKPTFLLSKTKCYVKPVINTENKTNNSLVVYRLTPDVNKDLLKRTVASTDPSLSSEAIPRKKRYLVSQKSGLVYEILQKSPLNGNYLRPEAEEPESDLISDDQYFKYLGLITSKQLKSESKCSLNQWPLRNISKSETKVKRNEWKDIIVSDVCPKPTWSKSEALDSNKSENSCEVSRRKLSKDKWREEVLDSTQRFGTQNKVDINSEMSRSRDKEMREWKAEAVNTISSFELSSFMGKRIFRSLFSPLNDLQKYLSVISFENNCCYVQHMYAFNGYHSSNCVQRITRSRDGSDWNRRHFYHKYWFTRRQRLDNWQRLETGLNRRSRLLKSRCKRLYIRVDRLNKCPICAKSIVFNPNHLCFEFESHLRQQNSLCFSETNDSSHEVIIIGDDFNEEMAESGVQRNDSEYSEEVITANGDEEDDDIMIIEEVFNTKPINHLFPVKVNELSAIDTNPFGESQDVKRFQRLV